MGTCRNKGEGQFLIHSDVQFNTVQYKLCLAEVKKASILKLAWSYKNSEGTKNMLTLCFHVYVYSHQKSTQVKGAMWYKENIVKTCLPNDQQENIHVFMSPSPPPSINQHTYKHLHKGWT